MRIIFFRHRDRATEFQHPTNSHSKRLRTAQLLDVHYADGNGDDFGKKEDIVDDDSRVVPQG